MKTKGSKEEFNELIKDLLENDLVQEMKKYRQHYDVSTYDHCLNVAYLCYKFTRKHKSLDYKSMTRAAMLHDLYLYDWRNHVKQSFFQMHAFSHPKTALINARKVMKLNKKEEDIIKKHMWPLTIVPPRYRESYIITWYDKYSTLSETHQYYKNKRKQKKEAKKAQKEENKKK